MSSAYPIIDRDWPHQVALAAERCSGGQYATIRLFCEDLSLSPRGHSFRRDNTDWNVFCFARREHAEKFREHFGGEIIEPSHVAGNALISRLNTH